MKDMEIILDTPCTEFTIGDYKGHYIYNQGNSILAVSNMHGIIYHKCIPINDGYAEHKVDDLIIGTSESYIIQIKKIPI